MWLPAVYNYNAILHIPICIKNHEAGGMHADVKKTT